MIMTPPTCGLLTFQRNKRVGGSLLCVWVFRRLSRSSTCIRTSALALESAETEPRAMGAGLPGLPPNRYPHVLGRVNVEICPASEGRGTFSLTASFWRFHFTGSKVSLFAFFLCLCLC